MIRQSYTAVLSKGEDWAQNSVTEPYEAGWAGEAIFYVRALEGLGESFVGMAYVQISPDGMRWVDEGTSFFLPRFEDEVTFGKVSNFGNYLRLRSGIHGPEQFPAVITLALKA